MNDTNNGSNSGNDADSSGITKRLVPEDERMAFVDRLFGVSYVLKLEPTMFQFAEHLAADYHGGYWQFYELSNGGFYMAPRSHTVYTVSSANGFDGQMAGDALGITACLFSYSHLSFGDGQGEGEFTELCANHYHWLREYAIGHREVRSIFQAID